MAAEYKIVHNEKLMHFEIHEGNEIAFLEYRLFRKDIALMHTEVPESMEGKGVATALASYAFKYAKEHGKPVMVYCPFISVYVKRNPEAWAQVDKKPRN